MTELVEYALAVTVSTLFVSGSVVVYSSFASFESGLELRSDMGTVASLASRALAEGTSSGTLTLPASTIGCGDNSLTLTFGSRGIAQAFPAGCDFSTSILGGEHTLTFSTESGALSLRVT